MPYESKIRKLLALVPGIDLGEPLGGTLAWWQLLKALNNLGVEITVVPFIGRCIWSPWWHCYPNPTRNISKLAYSSVKQMAKKTKLKMIVGAGQIVNFDEILGRIIEPKWSSLIDRIFRNEKYFDAAILISLPIRPFVGLVRHIKSIWSTPIIYFEADMPEVLPQYNTFGYSYYRNTDLSIFDGFVSNSEGIKGIVKALGARNIFALHYAIDPEVYKPFDVTKALDIFFSGRGKSGREEWINKMVISPAKEAIDLHIGLSGGWQSTSFSNVLNLGYPTFDRWIRVIRSSRINLNISRKAHASVSGTSTYRVFELAGLGSAIVTNPHRGIDKWYCPGKEIYVLGENEDPLKVYRYLLSDEELCTAMGEAALRRTLKEHTYTHRASSLLRYLVSVI